MSAGGENSEKLFKSYISNRKVMIADPNGASRRGLAKLMVNLGAKTNHLILSETFAESQEQLQKQKPHVILSEYDLPGGSGIDLAGLASLEGNPSERLFVIVTSNSSQSAVAQAAEEDVDAYVIKPYTIQSISEQITRAILVKLYPSDYLKAIEYGKELLQQSKPEEAMSAFDRAKTLNPKPSLALFYRGQAELFKRLLDDAEGSYQHGLTFNEIHYKCITGLFDLLLDRKKNTEAYFVVKKIIQVFPANPKRLVQVLNLAVQTGNFKDIETVYESFQSIDVRNEELVKYICAAMVVCGRHFLRHGNLPRGVDLLRKASVTAAGRGNVLREIISTCCEYGFTHDAEKVLGRFPPDLQSGPDYVVSKFLILNAVEQKASAKISQLLQILKNGPIDPMLSFWLIKLCVQDGRQDEALSYRTDALKHWPGSAALFEKALQPEEKPS